MSTLVEQLKQQAGEAMQKSIEYLDEALQRIRAGKANVKLLDGIMVPYYGSDTPLNQVSSITLPDARSIVVTPWEKGILKDIEKAIMDSDLGITPENNGEVIRIGIPPLTGERRQELLKVVKSSVEEAKISIRNARRDAIDKVKKSIKSDATPEDEAKGAEADIQKLHDKYIAMADDLYNSKEKEVLTV